MRKTIVLGLDGAHFELIGPWLEAGELPNIKELIEGGVSADMEVCLPPVTSPNWKCYSTGKNPAELGIFWWENIDSEHERVYYPSQRKNRHKEIWDHLGEAGHKVCVIGTPLTYPPKEVNGVMISGGPDCRDTNFTYPSELERELEQELDYKPHPDVSLSVDRKRAIGEIHKKIDLNFKAVKYLMEKEDFDFVQITTFYLNSLQHFLWDDRATKEAWKIIDQHLGDLREKYNANFILMSDHGSNKIETVFNINTWLNEEGYLRYNFKYRLFKSLYKLGLNKERLARLAEKVKLRNFLSRILPSKIKNVPTEAGEMKKEAKTDKVDWKRSKAIASGQGPIYLLDKSEKEELRRKLEKVRDDKGKKVIERVWTKEEIYSGQYLDEAPDLIIDQAPHVHITGGIGKEDVFGFKERWQAENKKYGLFVAFGPDFKSMDLKKISILDLAPTILDLYNLEISSTFDGQVRSEIFS